ncbi:MAG: hypothetical protein JHC87_10190, partial [Thermoleophilaceae bacterium]|nr:hypothetical protein [Thermoleophilaceae bacterium]
ITREDVELLGTGESVPKVFAFGDAVIEGDGARAINLARELIASGERPQGMQFALVRTFSQAQRAAAVLSEGGDVADELGISPWLAGRVTTSARLRGPDVLAQAMVTLAQLDRDSKGGNALDDETNLMVALNELTA